MKYDLIIVGAGAAGCVLAGRLSESPRKGILLLEAGPDAPPGREHPDIRDSFPMTFGNPELYWRDLKAETFSGAGEAPYMQGFGVGGGSNVNGMAADRGIPSDYDEWRDLGAAGWGWEDVLPYFIKLENDHDFAGELHGREGPMPVRRIRPDQWAPLAKAVAQVLVRNGAGTVEDFMGDFHDGVSSTPMSCLEDRRVSASMAYLSESVRARPNFNLLTGALVERLTLREGVVRGVEVRIGQERRAITANEVIVACGGVQSPALLLRSGIGPKKHLEAVGVTCVHDLPGVGRNLQNHPAISCYMHLKRCGRQSDRHRPWQQNQYRYSSNVEGCAAHDMLMFVFNKGGWHPLGRQLACLTVVVQKAYSQGYVELSSGDPAAQPVVRFNSLQDERDHKRLVLGLKMALGVLAAPETLQVRNEVFRPNFAIADRLAKRSTWNFLQAWAMTQVLNIAPLRRALLQKRVLDVCALQNNPRGLEDYIRANPQMSAHGCGTCKMGSAEDPQAVVNSTGQVFGIRGLRVADASIFPTVPSGHIHFPVLMVAEKIADAIKMKTADNN